MKAWMEMILFMPQSISGILLKVGENIASRAEEVRIRAERPLALIVAGKAVFLSSDGGLVCAKDAYVIKTTEFKECMRLLSQSSLYAWEDELRQGYVTVQGGHRVGLSGRVLIEKGSIRGMKDIASINFRIAREIFDCAVSISKAVLASDPLGTLIIGPPRSGKTTILRDLIRLTSLQGYTTAVVDERSEIAACWQGIPQKNLGPNTDVLDACPKAEGMMMMIRSLGPHVIAVDEIGRKEDAQAIAEAGRSGVTVYATAHASNLDEACQRPILQEIIMHGLFEKIVVLNPLIRGSFSISDFAKGLKVC